MKRLRTVDDVMTHAVISVDRHVAGVVSEADLLLGTQDEEEARAPRDVTAEQLMTRPAVTVTKDATIAGAARLMARGHLKRLPVVDADGRLVGMVSRGDLLKVYLRPDTDIGAELRELIMYQLVPHGHGPAEVHVHVTLPDPALEDVVVRGATPFKEIARLLREFAITARPDWSVVRGPPA